MNLVGTAVDKERLYLAIGILDQFFSSFPSVN